MSWKIVPKPATGARVKDAVDVLQDPSVSAASQNLMRQ